LAASACLLAAVLAHVSQQESRLLRADPNAIPMDPAVMAFAQGRGEALYVARCATCHGVNGHGDPQRGIPDLSDGDWLYGAGLVSDIEQIIKYGIRSYRPKAWNLAIMPAYATPLPSVKDNKILPLSPANIRDLVEFLMYEQGHDAGGAHDATSAAVVRGAALFSGAGGCYDCHAADAKGDAAIGAPNLTDGITLYGDGSRESLTASISRGRAGVCPAWDTRISAAGIRELAVFVYSLSHLPRAAAWEGT
jgi:cytochrome c oxidase cbb3-type subunit 3